MRVKAVKGMKDILPDEMPHWHFIEKVIRELTAHYGYQEIRTPVVERDELFHRSIGDASDIVMKEMYTFEDRDGSLLSLRPEGTAPIVRAGLEHGLLHNQVQRLWYIASMFRHERPQLGRYRQFYQFGVEAYGMPGPDIDAEMIFLSVRLLQALGLDEKVSLQLNTLGDKASRDAYQKALVEYFSKHESSLDEDSKRRLSTNPLRILDSKNPALAELIANAPKLSAYLSTEANQHFDGLRRFLDEEGLAYQLNEKLVRGLDYYSHTVFEWVTDELGSQNAVCAGGRYDALVEQLGGKTMPAIGFAAGIERLVALLKLAEADKPSASRPDIYFVIIDRQATHYATMLSERLRNLFENIKITCDYSHSKPATQFKRADASGARLAFVIGDEEVNQGTVSIKFLREAKQQINIEISEVEQFLTNSLSQTISTLEG